jgi:serine/threonine protein kinase
MTDIQDNGLYLEGAPFGLEKIYDYEPGGHHPVHLGDHLGEAGRYRIIHKLGNGGCANVWLCRDTAVGALTKYLALKILVADASKPDCPELLVKGVRHLKAQQDIGTGADYICLPLDEFTINGPNGSHICFVYPVLGPQVSLGILYDSENPDAVLRKAGLQAVQALNFLHQNGLCHGVKSSNHAIVLKLSANDSKDFTAANILHHVSGLDGLSEDEVVHVLGEPRKNRILTDPDECPDNPTAPHYLVYPVSWANVETNYISSDISVIDFGQAFRVSDPPDDLGIPGPYRSPELLLDRSVSMSCDIWALGCTLFAIRTGRTLFSCFDDEDDEYLETMVNLLGKMPEPW